VTDNCGDDVVTPVDTSGSTTLSGVPGAIPDADPASYCDDIVISGLPVGATVTNVVVDVAITHTWVGDLEIALTAPSGTTDTLLDRPGIEDEPCCGCLDDNLDISFYDGAATDYATIEGLCNGDTPWYQGDAQPQDPFSNLNGTMAAGTWTLCVEDNQGADVGTLDSWSITVEWTAPNGRMGVTTLVSDVKALRTAPIDLSAFASRSAAEKRAGVANSANERGELTLWNDYNMTSDASDDYPVGTTTVMWVAFDESGNSDTCYQDITVIDTEAPDPGCPSDIDIFANVYECSAIVEWELDTTDNCPGPLSIESNYEPGDTFPLGTTTVVYNVTDVAGNSASCSFDITVTSDLTITIDSVVDVSCFGGSDGAIFATISGGVEPYTIRWSNDQHTEDIDGLEPGSYVMYVEDAIGCSAISELIEVGEPTPIIEAAPAVITDSDCNGEAGGSIDVSISGGTPPYSYDWSNGSTDEDPSGLTAGTYQFTATDANGCTFLSPIYLIQEPTAISIASVITTDAGCNGAATGAIDIEVSGGTSPYSFLWSNGLTDEDPSGLVAGDYSVTITDGNGCEITSEDITVGEPSEIVITASTATDAECNGDASGSINISVAGGTPPYTYFWSNGEDTQDIDGLAAGDYTGTITDANGCTLVSPTITIGEPDEISVTSLVIEDADCNGASTGGIDIEVAGGTAPYTYYLME